MGLRFRPLGSQSAPRTKFLAQSATCGHQINNGYDQRHHGMTADAWCYVSYYNSAFGSTQTSVTIAHSAVRQRRSVRARHRVCNFTQNWKQIWFQSLYTLKIRVLKHPVELVPRDMAFCPCQNPITCLATIRSQQWTRAKLGARQGLRRAGRDPKNASSIIQPHCRMVCSFY